MKKSKKTSSKNEEKGKGAESDDHSLAPSDAADSRSAQQDRSSSYSEYSEEASAVPTKSKILKVGAKGIYSSYAFGTEGRCRDCKLVRKQCKCHHCRVCGTYMVTLHSRHHCRRCWKAVCPACSSNAQVSNFKTGVKGRVCDSCAPQVGLCFVTATMANYSVEVRNKTGRLNDPAAQRVAPSITWGLHVLRSAMETTPRCCTNPSCLSPFSMNASCTKCQLPTVATAVCVTRSVATYSLAEKNRGLLTAAESSASQNSKKRVENGILDASGRPMTVFNGLDEDDSRKMLLASVAADIANEYHGSPVISLAMSDLPYATQMRVVRVEKQYTQLEAAGKVHFFAIPHIYNKKKLAASVDQAVVTQEVWSTGTTGSLGILCDGEEQARQLGGKEMLVRGTVQCGVLTFLDQERQYEDIINAAIQIIEKGEDVVLCGHSVGGSIATLIVMKLLLRHTSLVKSHLLCATFGAPLVVNQAFTEFFAKHGISNNFQHVVYGSDLFPRMSYLSAFIDDLFVLNELKSVRESYADNIDAADMGSSITPSVADSNEDESEKDKKGKKWELRRPSTLEEHPSHLTISKARVKAVWWASLFLPSPSAPIAKFNKDLVEKKKKRRLSNLGGLLGRNKPPKERESSFEASDTRDPNQGERGDDPSITDAAKLNEEELRKKGGTPSMITGDVFAQLREPFETNFTPQIFIQTDQAGREHEVEDEGKISRGTEEYRKSQVLDPLGCYHFLWRGGNKYEYSSSPAKTIGLLSDRGMNRMLLKDHLMNNYLRCIMEYYYSERS